MKTFHPELLEVVYYWEKRNKAKCLTWNSIRLQFVKKTSMLNPAKSLGYIKCHSSSSPRPVESPSNSIRYNCEKICSWSRKPKTILEIRKKATKRPIIYQSSNIKKVNDLPILYGWTTNDLLMQFLCYYHCQLFTNHLPSTLILFYYIGHIVAAATNYSNLLFTSDYQ